MERPLRPQKETRRAGFVTEKTELNGVFSIVLKRRCAGVLDARKWLGYIPLARWQGKRTHLIAKRAKQRNDGRATSISPFDGEIFGDVGALKSRAEILRWLYRWPPHFQWRIK